MVHGVLAMPNNIHRHIWCVLKRDKKFLNVNRRPILALCNLQKLSRDVLHHVRRYSVLNDYGTIRAVKRQVTGFLRS